MRLICQIIMRLLKQLLIQMSYQEIDDSGQFNDSMVYLHPLRLTQKTAQPLVKHTQMQQSNLGIYDNVKLSSLIKSKQGEVIELISLDRDSGKTFVNEEGEELLRQYPTNDIAFVMIVGNQKTGKSFFCDKILNLSEIRGNHFCRKKNLGINIWSTPFQKQNLKIFLLQISGCSIKQQNFKILLTYSILIGSAFIIIEDLNRKDQQSALQQFDIVLSGIFDKITPSKLQKRQDNIDNIYRFLPQFCYYLKRRSDKQKIDLSLISNYIEQKLPDAKVSSFEGDNQQLIHVPFLDIKCINQQYIRKISHIFKQLHEVISQKKYNDLILTGSILIKIIKYIQTYINNNKNINIQQLYQKIIQDLYQSAYNYCILSYHQEMQSQFQNQQPKSLDQLISIFQISSHNVLQKFQQFTLDQKFHNIYQNKLQNHINQKQIMILDINKLKTQRIIRTSYQNHQIKNYQNYIQVINRIKTSYPTLNHGQTQALATLSLEFYSGLSNVDHKSLRQVDRLKSLVNQSSQDFKEIRHKNQQKSRQRGLINKQHQQLYQKEKRIQQHKKLLRQQIQKIKLTNFQEPDSIIKQREHLEQNIKKNNTIIAQYKRTGPKKNKDIVVTESKIEEVRKNNAGLEKILAEMRNNKRQEKSGGSPSKNKNKQ